jgi:hypothetical protein
MPNFIDDGYRLVTLLAGGDSGLVVQLKVFLNRGFFALVRLRDGCNELGYATRFDYLLSRLAARGHLPMPSRILIMRVENSMLKIAVFHRKRLTFAYVHGLPD